MRSPAGAVGIDPTGRANGRGAYLCRAAACWTLAATRSMLDRALDTRLPRQAREVLALGPDSVLDDTTLRGLRIDTITGTPTIGAAGHPAGSAPDDDITLTNEGGTRGQE